MLQGKDDVNKLRELLEKERKELTVKLESLGNMQADYTKLLSEHEAVRGAYDRLSRDFTDSLATHKQVNQFRKSESKTICIYMYF